MKSVFVKPDDSAAAQAAVTRLARALDGLGPSDVSGFLTEIRKRGIYVGVSVLMLRAECSHCGSSREVPPEQLGWLLYCDICGSVFAEPDNPWTRWAADSESRRPGAPFDQVDGHLRRLDLQVDLALAEDSRHTLPRSGEARLLVADIPGEQIAIRIQNRGRLPVPAGYLSTTGHPSESPGPRPLIGQSDHQRLLVDPPRGGGEKVVDLHFRRGCDEPERVARVVLEPLGSVEWRLHGYERDESGEFEARQPQASQSPRFAIQISFSGRSPSLGRARGQLRLPDRIWPLRFEQPERARRDGCHLWTTAVDVVVTGRSEFEVRLEYADVVGPVRIRGTINGLAANSGISPPLALTRHLPTDGGHETRLLPVKPMNPPKRPPTFGWGVPLVVDAGPSGLIAGCADGQGSILHPTVSEPTSIQDAAAALQAMPGLYETANADPERSIGSARPNVVSFVDHAWLPMDQVPDSFVDGLVLACRGLVDGLAGARPGHLDQISMLYAPTVTSRRLGQIKGALSRVLPDAKIYLDVDRATALLLHTCRDDLEDLAQGGGAIDSLVFDMGLEQTSVSVHRLSRMRHSGATAGTRELEMTTSSAVALRVGYLDVLDELGRLVLEPALLGQIGDDDPGGSVDTMVADESVWLFSAEERQRWMERSTPLIASPLVQADVVGPKDIEVPPEDEARDGDFAPSASRTMALRLLTTCLIIRLQHDDSVGMSGIAGAEGLLRSWSEEALPHDGAGPAPTVHELAARCVMTRSRVEHALRKIMRRLVEPARGVVERFIRGSADKGRGQIVVHGPGLVGDALAAELEELVASSTLDIRLLLSEGAPALRGALTYYEVQRLGALDMSLRLPRQVDRVSTAVECLTPTRNPLIPVGCPLSLAVGYQRITHPACILTFRSWFEATEPAVRIPVSLDTLVYRDGHSLAQLMAKSGQGGELALKVRVECCDDSEQARVTCEVVMVTDGTVTHLMEAITRQRESVQRRADEYEVSHLPDGTSERILTQWPIELPHYPGIVVAAPVDLRDAKLV